MSTTEEEDVASTVRDKESAQAEAEEIHVPQNQEKDEEEGAGSKRKKRRSGWGTIDKSKLEHTTGFSAGSAVLTPTIPSIDTATATILANTANALIDPALSASRLHLLAQQIGLTSEEMKNARDLYVCNLPPRIDSVTLTEFLNAALIALKGKAVSGNPVSRVLMSETGRHATVEFRTMEEANNAIILNGINCFGSALRLTRTREYPRAFYEVTAARQVFMPITSCIVDGLLSGVPLSQPVSVEVLGPAFNEAISRIGPIVARNAGIVMDPPDGLLLRNLPPPENFSEEKAREFLTTFGPLKYMVYFGLPSIVNIRRVLSSYITKRHLYDVKGHLKKPENDGDSSVPLAIVCMDQVLAQPAAEGVCLFEYHCPLDSQELADTLKAGFTLLGRAPTPGALEPVLCEDDFLRLAVHHAIQKKLEPLVPVTEENTLIVPTRVLYFNQIAYSFEIENDENYSEVLEDIRAECKLTGKVLAVELIRSRRGDGNSYASNNMQALTNVALGGKGKNIEINIDNVIGWAFVEFASIEDACRTRRALNGRKYGGRPTCINYMSERKWAARDFSDIRSNRSREDSSLYCPELADHVPEMVKHIEEAERIGREAARLAATAAANAQFSGGVMIGGGPPPPPYHMLVDAVVKPDFDADVVRDEEEMDMD